MSKNYDIAMLLDFYGDLLTEKRREYLNLYYNEDLSLSEIAQNMGSSRQCASDAIKRAEKQLIELEQKLSAVENYRKVRENAGKILQLSDMILTSPDKKTAVIAAEIRLAALELKNLG